MAASPPALVIELPPEATAQDNGPFFGVHCGVITGIYNVDGWPFVHALLKSAIARKFVDPVFARFKTWNTAVWFRKTGVKLDETSANKLGELARPPREILSGEVFSALYPAGTTVVHQEYNIIVPYTGREVRDNQVFMMVRAFVDNGNRDGSDNGSQLAIGHRHNNRAAPLPVPKPLLSSASLYETHTQLGPSDTLDTMRRGHDSPPPPTLANTDSRPPSPQPATSMPQHNNDAWVYHRSTYVPSPTIVMSSSEPSPKHPPTGSMGSQQHFGSQASTSSGVQLPGSQELNGQLQIVIRKAHHRVCVLSNLRYKDPDIESQICTQVILHLLASGDFTADGLTEIMNAATDLSMGFDGA
ncbi:hypothetical protein RSOLAG1IB_11144 [Rhizoctonia solani AG-1 IB]|uniref:Uncharacterized protein n=1 Tax=Thanatephorus cucumeris (strain AG1-IB / isolate 7/3/14) TaxID=1108050 RepID=M5C4E0_THACB|nr:hypothetical protein BN14_08277 [Rhizoctonia solani AG-1 IB]CEL52799.1 hypothetical protein RSOLAG1IB_11144 [Rhizoctonia solani AG-1 IB]